MSKIKVRFAPSPTGKLHIGSARTALINYLFAKVQGGTFIVRIEDTDKSRSTKDNERDILTGLKWLGLSWDEGPDIGGKCGPYYQSERIKEGRYSPYINELIKNKKAYYCFCTAEELDEKKKEANRKGMHYKYDGKCRNLRDVEIEDRPKKGSPFTIRFKVESKHILFKDLIRGDITMDMGLEDDFIIQRSDGSPTYNFVVVIDDYEMGISHVIRGEDHISNTPKQILIYRALKLPEPTFGHLSIILGPDKTKLSKRHGAKSINEYDKEGYVPEALFNYILLLGWSEPGGR